MKKIEKYIKGNLNYLSTLQFERKMKKDRNFRRIVILYKNVDTIMQGAFQAREAKAEMERKKLDSFASELVPVYYKKKVKSGNFKEFLN